MTGKKAMKILKRRISEIDKKSTLEVSDVEEIEAIKYAIAAIKDNEQMNKSINSLINTVKSWKDKRKETKQ